MCYNINITEVLTLNAFVKQSRIQELYTQMAKTIKCIPTHFDSNGITIIDPDFGNRPILVKMNGSSKVTVVVEYLALNYGKSVNDRRDVVKTAKDIFDFFHDLRSGVTLRMSDAVKGAYVPALGLYYSNHHNRKAVVLTSTREFDFDHFFFSASEELLKLSHALDGLTSLIRKDVESGDKNTRWDKEVLVGKNWWRH